MFFYIFAFIFVHEWYNTNYAGDHEFFSYWTVECKLYTQDVVEVYMFWILQLPYLVPCAAVILFKSSQDIIQGVSKLDYLYKVSIFQVYRDEVMQTTKALVLESSRKAFTTYPKTSMQRAGLFKKYSRAQSVSGDSSIILNSENRFDLGISKEYVIKV